MPQVDYYNLTNLTARDGNMLVNFIQFTSENTNYLPGLLILLAFYLIIFFVLKSKGSHTIDAFAACNFVNFVLALLFYPLQMVGGVVLLTSILLLPISVFLLWITHSH